MRPDPKYWVLYEHGTHSDCSADQNLASSLTKKKKCFQTDFKPEFRRVLDRTFSVGLSKANPLARDSRENNYN